MLFFVGIGLSEGDISIRALEALKGADEVIAETYTSTAKEGYIKFLSDATGKSIKVVGRDALEEKAKEIISSAEKSNIALLVPGDPLVATTHTTILNEAARRGVRCSVYHAASVFSAAIGESGLDIYKFGPTTTIPFWSERYKPTSFLDVIKKNRANGEHTLVLLDYNQKEGKSMGLAKAITLLKKAEEEKGYGIIKESTMFLALGNVGRDDEKIIYSSIGKADAILDHFNGKDVALIIPAEANFAEEEALSRFTSST